MPTSDRSTPSGTRRPLAIVGVGKIARDQHIPTLDRSPCFRLVAAVSPHPLELDVPVFPNVAEMAHAMPEVEAVSICTPPGARLDPVRQALDARLHVILEKPTAATVAKARAIEKLAGKSNRTIFASWHSREAAGVDPLRKWLCGRHIVGVEVSWKEDIRVWHPGQDWIFSSSYGVFDPGINALSILTAILPHEFFFSSGTLAIPSNREAPIAADLTFRLGAHDAPIHMALDFDFRAGTPEWNIIVTCEGGETAELTEGGHVLSLPSGRVATDGAGEYDALYQRFADLIEAGRSDFDLSPMIHVFDALSLSKRVTAGSFQW